MNQTLKQPKSAREYLDALTWDGKRRIDRWLVDYAGADNTPYVRAVSRAVLVAAVRRARQPGSKLDGMLVISGPQGCGKSSALRVLGVDPEWYTDDAPIGDSSIVEATRGKWIVELSELQGMGAGDVDALKAFLGVREDVQRQAYQSLVERVPRSFVVVGTTNAVDYLSDPVGNRRFWEVCVQRFDLDRLRADRDQLWAEAAAAEGAASWVSIWSEALAEQEYAAQDAESRSAESVEISTTNERVAYVVINDQFGVQFSSDNLDVACSFVSDKLRRQAEETSLINPSSYCIKRVPAG